MSINIYSYYLTSNDKSLGIRNSIMLRIDAEVLPNGLFGSRWQGGRHTKRFSFGRCRMFKWINKQNFIGRVREIRPVYLWIQFERIQINFFSLCVFRVNIGNLTDRFLFWPSKRWPNKNVNGVWSNGTIGMRERNFRKHVIYADFSKRNSTLTQIWICSLFRLMEINQHILSNSIIFFSAAVFWCCCCCCCSVASAAEIQSLNGKRGSCASDLPKNCQFVRVHSTI